MEALTGTKFVAQEIGDISDSGDREEGEVGKRVYGWGERGRGRGNLWPSRFEIPGVRKNDPCLRTFIGMATTPEETDLRQ